MTNRIPTLDTDFDQIIENAKVDALVNLAASDTFSGYPLANSDLSNSNVTVAGNAVSLGGSTSIAHGDLSTIGSDDHHTRYSDEEAQDAVGTIMTGSGATSVTYDDAGNTITVSSTDSDTTYTAGDGLKSSGTTFNIEPFDFAGTALEDDGSDNLQVSSGGITSTQIDESDNYAWTGSQDFTGGTITVSDPTSDNHAADKQYVDSVASGLDVKDSVVAATNPLVGVDLTSTSDPNPIDGVTLADGDRVLLRSQNTSSDNGIYVAQTATDPTTWTRASDFDEDSEVTAGAFTFVEEGTNNADKGFVVTSDDPITVGTDAIEFAQFSGAGQITAGDGLSKSGDTLSIVPTDFAGNGLEVSSGDLAVSTIGIDIEHNFSTLQTEVKELHLNDGFDASTPNSDVVDISVNANDLNGAYLDVVSGNLDVNLGSGLKGDGSNNITVEPADFAGSGLQDDGSDNLELTNDTVTVAGNAVSLGGSTGISHSDLSTAPSDAHHAETIIDVEDDNLNVVNDIHKIDFESSFIVSEPANGRAEVALTDVPGSTVWNQRNVSSNVTLSEDDSAWVDASGGAVTVTLPTPSAGVQVRVIAEDENNSITISRNGSEKINGSASDITMQQNEVLHFESDGTNWWIV